jgi:hypothetical protein
MDILHCPSPDGEAPKRFALDLLENRREEIVGRARRALLSYLLEHGAGTIDRVRELVPVPPSINPKLFGAVPGPLALSGIIRPAGFTKTTRTAGHARPVTIWELADRAAALKWLATHPDGPAREGGAVA